MEKYFKRKAIIEQPLEETTKQRSKQTRVGIDLEALYADLDFVLGLQVIILNNRDKVRRVYLQKEHCQPPNYIFSQKLIENTLRFNKSWFNEIGGWLEYSISKDAAFCLYCYIFRQDIGKQGSGDSLILEGFT